MADINRQGDLEVRIVDPTAQYGANVVYLDEDGTYALRVKANLSGTEGTQATLSKANKFATNKVTSATGWNVVLNLTVPAGYTWYLKGALLASSSASEWRVTIDAVDKMQGTVDAGDSMEIELYGYELTENQVFTVDLNPGSTNRLLYANLIIYEVAN